MVFRDFISSLSSGPKPGVHQRGNDHSKILRQSLREDAGRIGNESDKRRRRDEVPVPAQEEENEELQRFERQVWNQVTDVDLRSSNADSKERRQMKYIADISYKILSGRVSQLLQETQEDREQLRAKCKDLEHRIDTLTQAHGKELTMRNTQHVSDLGEADRKHQQETVRIQQDHQVQLKEIKGRCNWHLANKDGEIESLKLHHAAEIASFDTLLSETQSKLQATKQDRDFQIKELKNDHKNQTGKLKRHYGDQIENMRCHYEDKIAKLRSDHEEQTKKLRDDQEHQTGKLKHDHEDQIEKLGRHYGDQIRNMKCHYEAQIAKLRSDYEEIIKRLRSDHEEQLKKLKFDYEDRIQNLKQELADQTADYEHSINTLKERHADELMQMEKSHQREVMDQANQHEAFSKGLREEVHGLKNVLLKRDDNSFLPSVLSDADAKQEPDEHIKVKFLEIEQRVNDLSRLAWKSEQKVWTDQLLCKIGAKHDQTLLKKYILRDSIWSLLHSYMFCSPFRVFGKEGESLEREWNHNFLEGL